MIALGPGAVTGPGGSAAGYPDRRLKPARVSLEMLPARARVAGLPAPPDASTPAVGRRSMSSRRRRLRLSAVRIVTVGCLRGRPPRGGDDPIIRQPRNPQFDAAD